MQPKRVKIEKECVFDLLGFLFKELKNEKGIPLENDATRDINSYFVRVFDEQDRGFLRKTCKTLREKGVMEIEKWEKDKGTLCEYAARHNFLFLLQWALKNDYLWNEWTCAHAARGGHLNILIWLRKQVPPCPWNDWVCAWAARGGHLKVLKWLRKNGCHWNKLTCAYAAKGGHLDVLKWARTQNPPCPLDEETCAWAAERGHLKVLKWLRKNGCPWNEWTCSETACGGHLNILQWARAQVPPCPWDKLTCTRAAKMDIWMF